jgi:hypothetical protein
MSTLAVGDIFPSMKEAKLSITTVLKDNGQSYWTETSKPTIFVLKCRMLAGKDQTSTGTSICEFRV